MQIFLLILKILALILLVLLILIVLILLIPFKYVLVLTYNDNDLFVDLKYIVFHLVSNVHYKKPVKITVNLNGLVIFDTTQEKKSKKVNKDSKKDADEKNKLKNSNFIKNLDIKKAVTESKADIAELFRRAKEYQFDINSKKGKKVFVEWLNRTIIEKVKKIWPKNLIKTLKLVLIELQKSIITFLPKKIDTSLRFGLDNPFNTGIALAVLSPLYSIFGKKMNVLPSFSKEEISGTITFTGRPILIIPVISIIKLFFNRNFRMLIFKKKH